MTGKALDSTREMGAGRNDKTMIPHSRPTIGEEEAEAAARVIRTGNLAQGREVERFEQLFAEYHGLADAIGTSSGTAALHLSLLAMDIGKGDEVIIPSYVCTALANAVRYAGATPVLADVRKESGNIDPEDVKRRISRHSKAVIVPHLFGVSAEIEPLLDLDLPVIEDCAQSVGAKYQGRLTGTYGEVAVFSFYATKVFTTGEGGMVAANSRRLADAVRDLRDYDKRSDYKLRYNYKMTDFQAAMGRVQLGRLPEMIRKRKRIAGKYFRSLESLPLKLPAESSDHIYYRFVVDSRDGDADGFVRSMRNHGVAAAKPVSCPLHRYLNAPGFPNTEYVWKNFVSLPIYPGLSDGEVESITAAVRKTAKIEDR